jgi:hypothetical protein
MDYKVYLDQAVVWLKANWVGFLVGLVVGAILL